MIVQIKDLFAKEINTELFQFFKEQLIHLYNQLSPCDTIEDNIFLEFIKRSNAFLYVTEKMEVLGVVTALYERKLIHNGGIVCHIEDLVVHQNHRNKGIGSELVTHVIEDAKQKKCYKVILDCSEKMMNYYVGFEFEHKNNQMALYFNNA